MSTGMLEHLIENYGYWAVLIGIGGYLFGRALELVLGEIKTYENVVGAVLDLIGLLMRLIHVIRRSQHKSV
jgi:membrane protein DedA with SNARE-associated domain